MEIKAAENSRRNKNIKLWIILSGFVGLLPCALRLIFLASEAYRKVFNPMDILGDSIVFGLILNIVNIHHIDNMNIYDESDIKTFKGISALLIVFLVAIDIGFILREIIKYSTVALVIFSIILNLGTIIVTVRHFNLDKLGDESHV